MDQACFPDREERLPGHSRQERKGSHWRAPHLSRWERSDRQVRVRGVRCPERTSPLTLAALDLPQGEVKPAPAARLLDERKVPGPCGRVDPFPHFVRRG